MYCAIKQGDDLMKKLMIVAAMTASIMGVIQHAEAAQPYTAAQKNAINVLLKNGYHDAYITGQGPKQCSAKKDDFDWEMQVFGAVSKEGHYVTGIVCNNKVYLKTITQTNPPVSDADSIG
jgi:hypothetical protein